jgi:putative glutamine amidotransferase
MVNSTHHQAACRIGARVVVSAAAPDGVVEAIESTEHLFAVGVQWHPEYMLTTIPAHVGLYRTFIQKAREHRR